MNWHAIAEQRTVIGLRKACGRLEETFQKGKVDFFHGQILNTVGRPVHVMTDSLEENMHV